MFLLSVKKKLSMTLPVRQPRRLAHKGIHEHTTHSFFSLSFSLTTYLWRLLFIRLQSQSFTCRRSRRLYFGLFRFSLTHTHFSLSFLLVFTCAYLCCGFSPILLLLSLSPHSLHPSLEGSRVRQVNWSERRIERKVPFSFHFADDSFKTHNTFGQQTTNSETTTKKKDRKWRRRKNKKYQKLNKKWRRRGQQPSCSWREEYEGTAKNTVTVSILVPHSLSLFPFYLSHWFACF